MTARGRQQGNVVASALIAIGTAEVEDLGGGKIEILRIGEIGPRRHHGHSGDFLRPVLAIVDDEENVHDATAAFLCNRPLQEVPDSGGARTPRSRRQRHSSGHHTSRNARR
jgi:hypothetical protein